MPHLMDARSCLSCGTNATKLRSMKPLLFAVMTFVCLFSFSCKEAAKEDRNPNNDATKRALSKKDSASKAAMDIHNEVMPKMGKIIGYEKMAKSRVDSVQNLINIKKCKCEDLHDMMNEYSKLFVQLKNAEQGMNDWMSGYNAEPNLATEELRIAYFEDQKMKAEKMKADFFAALDKGQAMLGN